MNGMKEQLDKNISDQKDKIVDAIEKLETDSLMTSETPSGAALDELAKVKRKFDDYTKKVKTYHQYQDILEVNPTAMKEVDDFNNKYDVRHKLWKNRENFNDLQKHWYNDNFLELNAVEIV